MPFGYDQGDPFKREMAARAGGLPPGLDQLQGLPPEIAQSAANFLLQQQAAQQQRQGQMLPGAPPPVGGGGGGPGFAGVRPRAAGGGRQAVVGTEGGAGSVVGPGRKRPMLGGPVG